MVKVKLTKKDRELIAITAKEYERELLIEYLLESSDENIIDSLNETLLLVKLIMGEEIAKQVLNISRNKEEEILAEKERVREEKEWVRSKEERDDHTSIIERMHDYTRLKQRKNDWGDWGDAYKKIFDIEIINKKWASTDLDMIQKSKVDIMKIMEKFKS